MNGTFMAVALEHFGLHAGQSRMHLGNEINKVFPANSAERAEAIADLTKLGHTIEVK